MEDRGPGRGWREVGGAESRRLLAERLDRFLGAGAGSGEDVVLEVGCGDGRGTEILRERLAHVRGGRPARLIALDVDFPKLVAARRRLSRGGPSGVRLLAASLYDLPFPPASTRFLVALNVGYLIDRSRFFLEAAKVLAANGEVLFYDLIPKDGTRRWLPFTLSLSREQLVRPEAEGNDDRKPRRS